MTDFGQLHTIYPRFVTREPRQNAVGLAGFLTSEVNEVGDACQVQVLYSLTLKRQHRASSFPAKLDLLA